MTLGKLIEHLKLYPANHPTTAAIRWSRGTTFCVAWAPSTVGKLLAAFESAHVTSHYLCDEVRIDDGESPIETATPLLLRAWLGPVPVVLPEGCEVVDGQRRWREAGNFIFFHDNGAQQIQLGSLGVVLPAETLAWLRGEVSP